MSNPARNRKGSCHKCKQDFVLPPGWQSKTRCPKCSAEFWDEYAIPLGEFGHGTGGGHRAVKESKTH